MRRLFSICIFLCATLLPLTAQRSTSFPVIEKGEIVVHHYGHSLSYDPDAMIPRWTAYTLYADDIYRSKPLPFHYELQLAGKTLGLLSFPVEIHSYSHSREREDGIGEAVGRRRSGEADLVEKSAVEGDPAAFETSHLRSGVLLSAESARLQQVEGDLRRGENPHVELFLRLHQRELCAILAVSSQERILSL